MALGIGLGIYTGVLLSTMVARPLWNSAILGPLFLVSGLSAAAAMMHLPSGIVPSHPAPRSFLGGALAALVQPLGATPPEPRTAEALVKADLGFLTAELVLLGLLFVGLLSSSASHVAAVDLLMSGKYAAVFWGGASPPESCCPSGFRRYGSPIASRTRGLPALLVLAGGFALRWVLVGAGQASHVIAAIGM